MYKRFYTFLLRGLLACFQGSRDTMIYGISVETTGLDMAVDILADVVLRPVITEEYLEMIRTTIRYIFDFTHPSTI